MSDLLTSFERLLDTHIDDRLCDALDDAGFLDALRELPLVEVEPLIRALGRRGVAAPVADMMATRALTEPSPALLAVLASVEIAGGAERLLDMSLTHARDRTQFGKPIGAFQAIQQQLAVLAEKALLVRVVAQAACAGGPTPSVELAATAKATASAAVPVMAGIAHAVHGAIGMTAEFPLHRVTARMHALRMAHGSESYWYERLGQSRMRFGAGNSLDFVRGLEISR